MKLKPILVAICVLIGTLGLLGYMHYSRLESQLVEARAETLELRENLGEARAETLELRETLGEARATILELRESLGEARATILELRESLGEASDNIRALRERVVILENELKKAREGSRWELHDPTYQEVQDFIDEDDTDKNQYIKGEYVCVDFAADVNIHAMEKGIQCSDVYIRFEVGAHRIVAFETVDRGLIYVEPQDDTIIPELKVGQDYWDIVDKYNKEHTYKEAHGDTIQRIVILW